MIVTPLLVLEKRNWNEEFLNPTNRWTPRRNCGSIYPAILRVCRRFHRRTGTPLFIKLIPHRQPSRCHKVFVSPAEVSQCEACHIASPIIPSRPFARQPGLAFPLRVWPFQEGLSISSPINARCRVHWNHRQCEFQHARRGSASGQSSGEESVGHRGREAWKFAHICAGRSPLAGRTWL